MLNSYCCCASCEPIFDYEYYNNRIGINEIVGPSDGSSGLRAILELHSLYNIPLHLHISGTFIEACAWYEPLFLEEISELQQSGLLEILGSTYAQNIMPLFDFEHNYYQVQEELALIQKYLKVPISEVKGFWVPERVWSTRLLSKVLTDPSLLNDGFHYVLVDDRLFLQNEERKKFDDQYSFNPKLFEANKIEDGRGLIALPIANEMRWNIPLDSSKNAEKLNQLMSQLKNVKHTGQDVIGVYADDMEKAAGIPPWNPNGIEHYHLFLQWLIGSEDAQAILISEWLKRCKVKGPISIGPGAYRELAIDFGAGEDYLQWKNSDAWKPYQRLLTQGWNQFKAISTNSKYSSSLLDLARKHLLASTYETGWHDAPNSIHTDKNKQINGQNVIGHPAPWVKALASHARAANVMFEAAKWTASNNEEKLCCYRKDLDGDGHEEVILRNECLAIVVTPRFGGRIVYMFSYKDNEGVLVIGNPTDDWNWLEELNDFMDIPMNHPGALADYNFEHDTYEIVDIITKENDRVEIILINNEQNSPAFGMIKNFCLLNGERKLDICYEQIPSKILPLSIDIGCSPDYLSLLRNGRNSLVPDYDSEKRGYRTNSVFVWAYPLTSNVNWDMPRNGTFGHGYCLTFTLTETSGSFCIGVDTIE